MKTVLIAIALLLGLIGSATAQVIGEDADAELDLADRIAHCDAGDKTQCLPESSITTRQQTKPSIPLMKVSFDKNSAMLTTHSRADLSRWVRSLRKPKYSNWRLQISGHTDASGPRDYNIVLSQQRAEAVVTYLVSQGIDPRQLRAKGYGPDRLLWRHKPFDSRNRRVVVERLL